MKTRMLMGAALAAIAAAAASAASAQEVGPYIAADFGLNLPWDMHANSNALFNPATGAAANWTWSQSASILADGRVGYQFMPHFRSELEFTYRDGPIHMVGGGQLPVPTGVLNPSGHMDSYSLMLNGIYDILPENKWDPFIGVGVGPQQLNTHVGGTLTGILPATRRTKTSPPKTPSPISPGS